MRSRSANAPKTWKISRPRGWVVTLLGEADEGHLALLQPLDHVNQLPQAPTETPDDDGVAGPSLFEQVVERWP